MWKFSPFQIDPSTLRPCYLCHLNLIPLKPQDDEVTRSIYFANAVNVYTHTLKEEPRAGMYCNNCCNLLRVKAAEAAYHDAQMKNRDLVLQCILKQKGIASLCTAYPRDFIIEPGFSESAAGRVGWELYALINGVKLNNSQLSSEEL